MISIQTPKNTQNPTKFFSRSSSKSYRSERQQLWSEDQNAAQINTNIRGNIRIPTLINFQILVRIFSNSFSNKVHKCFGIPVHIFSNPFSNKVHECYGIPICIFSISFSNKIHKCLNLDFVEQSTQPAARKFKLIKTNSRAPQVRGSNTTYEIKYKNLATTTGSWLKPQQPQSRKMKLAVDSSHTSTLISPLPIIVRSI